MTKEFCNFKTALLIGTILTGYTPGLNAQSCTAAPDCTTLGYAQTAADCKGQQMLKCPFDTTKVFCGGVACPADYTLSGCETAAGSYVSCGTKCKYTSCNYGWSLSNGNCIANSCSGYYDIYVGEERGTFISCKAGPKYRYKYTSCKYGWKLRDGYFCEEDWSVCPQLYEGWYCHYKIQIEKDGPTSSCVVGDTTYYYNTSCFNGKTPNKGLCNTTDIFGNCF